MDPLLWAALAFFAAVMLVPSVVIEMEKRGMIDPPVYDDEFGPVLDRIDEQFKWQDRIINAIVAVCMVAPFAAWWYYG